MQRACTAQAEPPFHSFSTSLVSQLGPPLRQLQLGNGDEVHIVRAVRDAQRARAGPQPRQGNVVAHPCANMHVTTLANTLKPGQMHDRCLMPLRLHALHALPTGALHNYCTHAALMSQAARSTYSIFP